MQEMYDYELNKYVKTLFRLGCLDSDVERKHKIYAQIRKFKRQIKRCSTIRFFYKMAIILLPSFPNVFRKIFIYRNNINNKNFL